MPMFELATRDEHERVIRIWRFGGWDEAGRDELDAAIGCGHAVLEDCCLAGVVCAEAGIRH